MNKSVVSATAALATGIASAAGNGIVPLNYDRAKVIAFFEENVYGVRPSLEGFKPAAEVVKEERLEAVKAVRKKIRINTLTPIGEQTFTATAYFPEGSARVPGFQQPIREFDLAWQGKMPRWPVDMILARGCGTMTFVNDDVLKDDAHILDVIERPANVWGAISAWALASSRCAHHFFRRTSLSTSFSSTCSASSFFRRPFSVSSSFRRLASGTLMPPNLLRHR